MRNVLGIAFFVLSGVLFLYFADGTPLFSDKKRAQALYLEKQLPSYRAENRVLYRLRFETGLRKDEYLVKGFSVPEFWGSWTVGPDVELSLPLQAGQGQAGLSLSALVDGYVYPPKVKKQEAQIFVNGTPLGTWAMTRRGKSVRTLEIPAAVLKGRDKVNIQFKILHPTRPLDTGENKDTRLLGLGFTWLEVSAL